jgi:hypothetical protein
VIGASQPDQPAVIGINAVAAHLVRRQRRQAQQPGLHLAVELVEFYRPVPGLGILWLRRLGPDAQGPAAFQLRPEPPQGIRKLGAGVRTQSAVHGGGSHNTDDRMIGRQQVQQLVAQRGPGLKRIGLGHPVDERPQPCGLLLVGALEDVIPVFSYRTQQRIRWLPSRPCIGHGRDVPSSEPRVAFLVYHGLHVYDAALSHADCLP